MGNGKVANWVFPKEGSSSDVVGKRHTRRSFHLLVGATLATGLPIVGAFVTASLNSGPRWSPLLWGALLIFLNALNLRWQLRSQEESPEAIKERVSQLAPELRKQVQARSYGARRTLIEDPLKELDLDIRPCLGREWVRDPRLTEPEPVSEQIPDDDIVAAFESSKRRLLIVGEPGSGKTMAAYSLIEYLDKPESDERTPLLVNLSAWEAQDSFEAFLVDYLCSSVGYEVRERAVASAFISSDRYALILDGLDEIPLRLRAQFSERLDEFVRELAGEVGVVVTCRTQEYEELLDAHPGSRLGLVQAVEILPLPDQQLDSAFFELSRRDKDWETFLSERQRHLTAYKRVRDLLSNPLFLNLAVVGHLSPDQLLDSTTTEQDLRDLVLDSYLDSTLADQRYYRRYLSWVARFLNGDEVSPFGLKTTDYTVFNLADLTPPEPPRGYRLVAALILGGLFLQAIGLVVGLVVGLVWERWTFKRSALSSRLTFVWPSTKRRRHDFLRTVGWGLLPGLVGGLVLGLLWGILGGLIFGLVIGGAYGLLLWVVLGLFFGLSETRPVLIASRTPTEARSRSLISALLYVLITSLLFGLVTGLTYALIIVGLKQGPDAAPLALLFWPLYGVFFAVLFGMTFGLFLGMNNGGWFVVLQKVAHYRLAGAGNLPSRPYDFLEWGIEKRIFHPVGGVRFRHNLIQQHLASTSEGGS